MDIIFKKETNPSVVTKLNETVQNYHADQYPDIFLRYNYERLLPWFTEILADENVTAIVAYNRTTPIGYALLKLHVTKADNPYLMNGFNYILIDQMSINKTYQNQGIGQQLMEYILNYCQEQGVKRIQLSVWVDNKQAKHFYKKMGFISYQEKMEVLL